MILCNAVTFLRTKVNCFVTSLWPLPQQLLSPRDTLKIKKWISISEELLVYSTFCKSLSLLCVKEIYYCYFREIRTKVKISPQSGSETEPRVEFGSCNCNSLCHNQKNAPWQTAHSTEVTHEHMVRNQWLHYSRKWQKAGSGSPGTQLRTVTFTSHES